MEQSIWRSQALRQPQALKRQAPLSEEYAGVPESGGRLIRAIERERRRIGLLQEWEELS